MSSSAASLPEVVGDAGLYFDPHQPAQIADAIYRIATEADTLAALQQKARERAVQFTWSNAAQLALEHIERTAGAA